MRLEWGGYRQFPYERELALREVEALIGSRAAITDKGEVQVGAGDISAGLHLTYFSSVAVDHKSTITQQALLEGSALRGRRRQSTRYSVHGLHEYKGKFNPQVFRALINILGLREGDLVLDPFCGSGTTLVEAAHRRVRSIGFDLNPLAVFIANAKLTALRTPASELQVSLESILSERATDLPVVQSPRIEYLRAWFEPQILDQIEALRRTIGRDRVECRPFFLSVASNMLRDFSLQEPADLRIRRRASANAREPFSSAFARAARDALAKLERAQEVVGTRLTVGKALLRDNRARLDQPQLRAQAAITSPPYASALPYIDTQRLSLIWLGLLAPSQLRTREAELIGSRELSTAERRTAPGCLRTNDEQLPREQIQLCRDIQKALTEADGFRRRAVPILLYRYFAEMKRMFASVLLQLAPGSPYALIVGHNHTVIGGRKFDINTPDHLASLARDVGWALEEALPLQAYQRFGLHAANGVTQETLLMLRAPGSPLR